MQSLLNTLHLYKHTCTYVVHGEYYLVIDRIYLCLCSQQHIHKSSFLESSFARGPPRPSAVTGLLAALQPRPPYYRRA